MINIILSIFSTIVLAGEDKDHKNPNNTTKFTRNDKQSSYKRLINKLGRYESAKDLNARSKWNKRSGDDWMRQNIDCNTIDLRMSIIIDGALPLHNDSGSLTDFMNNEQFLDLKRNLRSISGNIDIDVNRIHSHESIKQSNAIVDWLLSTELDSDPVVRYYVPFKNETTKLGHLHSLKSLKHNYIMDPRHMQVQSIPKHVTPYSKAQNSLRNLKNQTYDARKAKVTPHHTKMLKNLDTEVSEVKKWYYKLLHRDGLEEWDEAEPKFKATVQKPMPTAPPLDWSNVTNMEYEEGLSWLHMGYKIPKDRVNIVPNPEIIIEEMTKRSVDDPSQITDTATLEAEEHQPMSLLSSDCGFTTQFYDKNRPFNLYKKYHGLIDRQLVEDPLDDDMFYIGADWWTEVPNLDDTMIDEDESYGTHFHDCVKTFELYCENEENKCSGFIVSAKAVDDRWLYCAVLESKEDAKIWSDGWINNTDSSVAFDTFITVDIENHPTNCDDRLYIDNILPAEHKSWSRRPEFDYQPITPNDTTDYPSSRRILSSSSILEVTDPALLLSQAIEGLPTWENRTGLEAFESMRNDHKRMLNFVLLVTDRPSFVLSKFGGMASIRPNRAGVHSSILIVQQPETATRASKAFTQFGEWLWHSDGEDMGGDVAALIVDKDLKNSQNWKSGKFIIDRIEKMTKDIVNNFYRCMTPKQLMRHYKRKINKDLMKKFAWNHPLKRTPQPKSTSQKWMNPSIVTSKQQRHSTHVPPEDSHEAQWYGAFTQVFNPCINVHESNLTFPIWVGGNWNVYDKETWARYGNVFAGGLPDYAQHTYSQPHYFNDQAFDFYNGDSAFRDFEGGVCGNALSSGDALHRPEVGSLFWPKGNDKNNPIEKFSTFDVSGLNSLHDGDFRDRYLTARMHDEVMRRNAMAAYRLSVYHPREVVNVKVGPFSAPGYNRWPGGEMGWGLLRQARYGKYQMDPILTEPGYSIGERDGRYSTALKQWWSTNGYRQAGLNPSTHAVDWTGRGYWGQDPIRAQDKLNIWLPKLKKGLRLIPRTNGMHFISRSYFNEHIQPYIQITGSDPYSKWIDDNYRGSDNVLDLSQHKGLQDLNGRLGKKEIRRIDGRVVGRSIQRFDPVFENNEKLYQGYNQLQKEDPFLPGIEDVTDNIANVYTSLKQLSPLGDMLWLKAQNADFWEKYDDMNTLILDLSASLKWLPNPGDDSDYGEKGESMMTMPWDATTTTPYRGNERFRFTFDKNSLSTTGKCEPWQEKRCIKRYPEVNPDENCWEAAMELNDLNKILSDQCGLDWLSIPGLDSPVTLSTRIQQSLAYQDKINRDEERLKPLKKPLDKLDAVAKWFAKLARTPLEKTSGSMLAAPGFEVPATAQYRPNPYNIRGDLRAMSGYNESVVVDTIGDEFVEAANMSQSHSEEIIEDEESYLTLILALSITFGVIIVIGIITMFFFITKKYNRSTTESSSWLEPFEDSSNYVSSENGVGSRFNREFAESVTLLLREIGPTDNFGLRTLDHDQLNEHHNGMDRSISFT